MALARGFSKKYTANPISVSQFELLMLMGRLVIPTPAVPLETQWIVNKVGRVHELFPVGMQNTWNIDMEVGTPYAFVPIHVPSNNILMIKGCIVSNYTL